MNIPELRPPGGARSLLLAADDGPSLAWHLPNWGLLLLVAGGIALLLLLILKAKLHAFIALLIVSAAVAFGAGVNPSEVPGLLEDGMGSSLGSIAIIVALGAMLGRMMEISGAAQVLSERLLTAFGEKRAPLAMGLTALIFGIPVFFDVGFIILVPLMYAVARRSGRSLLSIALPTVGGLAIMHAVLPPHPGPVAAAGLLGASLGWVALMGLICGLPAWFVGAYLFGKRMGDRTFVPVPAHMDLDTQRDAGGDTASGTAGRNTGGEAGSDLETERQQVTVTERPAPMAAAPAPNVPSLRATVTLIVLPVLLIMFSTFAPQVFPEGGLRDALVFVGDPITALTVTALLAFWILGVRGGMTREKVEQAASASLGPVALVLLVTGAGGVFGAVLKQTGAGKALASTLDSTSLPVVVLAFIIATILRVALGSKTVAIVTTAPIVAPLIAQAHLSQPEIALVVVAIASGGTVLSHVNDSGFWLFNRYLDLDIKATLKSWTLMETLMGGSAFVIAAVLSGVLSLT